MAAENMEGMPVISENGEVRFETGRSLKDALPKLRRGSLTVRGNGPPRGSYTFRVIFEAGGIDEQIRGDVVASVSGRAVLFLPELLPDFVASLEEAAARFGDEDGKAAKAPAKGAAKPAAKTPAKPAPKAAPPKPPSKGAAPKAPPPPPEEEEDVNDMAAAMAAAMSEVEDQQEPGSRDAWSGDSFAKAARLVATSDDAEESGDGGFEERTMEAGAMLSQLARAESARAKGAPPPAPHEVEDSGATVVGGLSRAALDAELGRPSAPPAAKRPAGARPPPPPPPAMDEATLAANKARAAAVFSPTSLDQAGVLPLVLKAAHHRLTGCLEVKKGTVVKIVSFLEGRPLELRSNDPTERFGEVLVAQGRIDRQQLAKALDASRKEGTFFGAVLVQQQVITEAELKQSLSSQAMARLADLFTWTEGLVRFDGGAVVDPVAASLHKSALELCRELVTPARGVTAERALRFLGAESRLAPAEAGQWLLATAQLTPVEQQVVKELGANAHTVHSLVAHLQTQGVKPGDAVLALFLLAQAGCLKVTAAAKPAEAPAAAAPSVSKEYDELKSRLEGRSLFRALGVSPNLSEVKLLERVEALKAGLDQVVEGLPNAPKLKEPLLKRLEEIRARVKDPLERAIETRAHTMGVDTSDPSTRQLLEGECLSALVTEAFTKNKFKDAIPWAKRELELRPEDPGAIAHHGLALALGSDTEKAKKEATQALLEASNNFLTSLDVQVACAKACLENGLRAQAKSALSVAQTLGGKDPRVVALVNALAGAPAKGSAKSADGPTPAAKGPAGAAKPRGKPEAPGAKKGAPRKNAKAEIERAKGAEATAAVVKTLIVVSVLFFILIGAVVGGGQGKQEYFYTGKDSFWFVRRILLVVAAVVGAAVVKKENPLKFFANIGYGATLPPVMLGIMAGTFSGWMSSNQRITGTMGTVIVLVIIHVACEEIFFSGFVTRSLMGALPGKAAVLFSGVIFGLYHVTYYSFFKFIPVGWIPYFLTLVILGAGLPYALLYFTSRSIVPPFVAHLACNLTAMLASLGMRDLPPMVDD